jgi:Carbohydrate esterase, sialic acid-specific acetylesterase
VSSTNFSTVAALVVMLVFGAFLVLYIPDLRYVDAKRNVRIALGLPKFWVTSFNEDVSRYTKVQCPGPGEDALVIITGGQSEAANSYGPAPPADQNLRTFMFYDGKCYKLQSPVLGATSEADSLWPTLGDKLNAETDRPVVFINGAVGGTQIGDWLDSRSGYLGRLAHQILLARKVGLDPDLVLWIQGETDAAVETDPESYTRDQQALIERLDALGATNPETKWVIYRSTHCTDRSNNGSAIERAISELASKESNRIVLGPRLTGYDDNLRRDGCHLNARGRDRLVNDTLSSLIGSKLVKAQRER